MRGSLILLALTACALASDQQVGEIDFFGYKGFDIEAIRRALPLHEGDRIPGAGSKAQEQLKSQLSEKVAKVIGQNPTDIRFVCCDAQQRSMVYIGLPGKSYQSIVFNPTPVEDVRLPKTAIVLNDANDKAGFKAIMKGHGEEDRSQGYSLMKDPGARKTQLAMRDYALQHEALILQILESSRHAGQRAIAAEMLGYAHQSKEQVDALVKASLDPDDDVRNNAVRALAVLGSAKPDLVRRVPLDSFIGLLRSGSWTDHNKASFFLEALTEARDSAVLERIRAGALDSLLEMARWHNPGHAFFALEVLGRIAGMDEDSLGKAIEANQTAVILSKFEK